jgi:hypothetical protein
MRVLRYLWLLMLLPLACTSDRSQPKQDARAFSIVGEWTGQEKGGPLMRFTFTRNGEVLWYIDEPHFYQSAPYGLRGRYSLRPSFPSYTLKIGSFREPRLAGVRLMGDLHPTSPSEIFVEFPALKGGYNSLKELRGKKLILNRR